MNVRVRSGIVALSVLFAVASHACAAGPAPSATDVPKSWLDRSHAIFFPSSLKQKLSVSQDFPLFWWNFLVLEIENKTGDWQAADKTCAALKAQAATGMLLRVECEQSLGELESLLGDWRSDLPLRNKRPSDDELRSRLGDALAKASLPAGDPELLRLLRGDPLESWHDLQTMAESRLKLSLARRGGFFYDDKSHRLVIPIQFAFSPAETSRTAELWKSVVQPCTAGKGCSPWGFIGPHASTLRNEEQVMRDLTSVSWVGTGLLVALGLGLFVTGRWRVFLLVPPVFVATGASMLVTIALFRSIHGLTLSFGTGIIGLALDYGLQAAFNPRSKRIWRSNVFGILTTLAGLLVLMTSSIPLLRQMMVFSCVGITAAFALFYLLFKHFPDVFAARAFPFLPRVRSVTTGLVLALMFCSVIGAWRLRPNLDMSQFDFQDARAQQISRWFFQTQLHRAPLFRTHTGAALLLEAHKEKSWADAHAIGIENVANYLPAVDAQRANLATWASERNERFRASLSETQKKFFAPFLHDGPLGQLPSPVGPATGMALRSYLAHLTSHSDWITLFFPASDSDEAHIRAEYPDASSLKEVVSHFPETFAGELAWMAPVSLFLTLALLFFYYRRMGPTLLALTPFFSGMGLVVVAKWVMGFEISFISVMALIMVFGFSIDYGIFATDLSGDAPSEVAAGVWTGLSFAVFATVAGFVPMLFCRHPVLHHLGLTLFFGGVGTFFGAVWGIPGIRRLAR